MDRATRLRQAIDQWRDGSVREFQRKIEPRLKERDVRGGSYAMIHRYLVGKPQPSVGFLLVAAGLLEVREQWLIDGQGAMTEAEEAVRPDDYDDYEEISRVVGEDADSVELEVIRVPRERFYRDMGHARPTHFAYGMRHLLDETVRRLIASCPDAPVDRYAGDFASRMEKGEPEYRPEYLAYVAAIEQMVEDLVLGPLRRFRIEPLEPPLVGHEDYLLAMFHALMLAVPGRKKGKTRNELVAAMGSDV